ncbi:MAG: magnesium chelatase [Dehalococcoidia bacterium]
MAAKPSTLGELRSSGYKVQTVKQEMRRNLIEKMRKGEDLFPGILGFEETVMPQLYNAILSGQDVIFLGERGQAKSRLIRSLVNLLDDEIPIIEGSEVNEDPFNPISKHGVDMREEHGDNMPIEWIGRDRRYGEKLATPDITIADLIGEVDPIRVAEGRYLSDELTIHYGLIPRTNRGIFAINELPDLAERIQVGLFNIMEERDIQIRGYRIQLPLDIFLVSSANPEDYTNRGRIITPLKDRYGVQIRTHYPKQVEHEIGIMEQERMRFDDEQFKVVVPQYMKEIVAEISRLARRSPDINQRSGVSVRASIANYESMLANAQRRAIQTGESEVVPRVSDLPYVIPAIQGKVEFETVEEGKEEQILDKLIQGAILAVFNRYFSVSDFDDIVTRFKSGISVEVGDMMPSSNYERVVKQVDGLQQHINKVEPGASGPVAASVVEFMLEGLHLNKRLNKDRVGAAVQYRG